MEPDRVVKWHRQGFAWFWRWKKRARKVGRPRVSRELRELIRRMALENGWGAPRIHAELSKLGFAVSERTVSRYVPRRPTNPDAVKRWLAFLRNHRDVIADVDFFSVPTATFQLLHVFFVIHHDRRRILQLAIADHPHADWVVQQLREAFPYDSTPRHLVLDRDGKYGVLVLDRTESTGFSSQRPCGPGE